MMLKELIKEENIESLRRSYEDEQCHLLSLEGSSGIGKTSLLQEFLSDKEHIYFTSTAVTGLGLAERFSTLVCKHFAYSIGQQQMSMSEAFSLIAGEVRDQRLAVVVDGVEEIVLGDREFTSELDRVIDNDFYGGNILLILSGDHKRRMDRWVKDRILISGELVIRRMCMKPLNYLDVASYIGSSKVSESLMAYAIFGGVPGILKHYDRKLSLKENVSQLLYDWHSPFIGEPERLMYCYEMRNPSIYNTILEALSKGAMYLPDINERIGEKTAKSNRYVSVLVEHGFVSKEQPIVGSHTRRTRYRVIENLFHFLYGNLYGNLSHLISEYDAEMLFRDFWQGVEQYAVRGFRQICFQYIEQISRNGDLGFKVVKMGSMWGKSEGDTEIDMVCLGDGANLFGHIHTEPEPVGIRNLDFLIEKSITLSDKGAIYILFSRVGFENAITELCEARDDVWLVSLEDMYQI